MSDFLSEMDCLPNINACTVAGKVLKLEPLTKMAGIAFTIGYQKHWPNGGTQEIPIRCYLTGAERVAKLDWLQVGDVVVIHGEVTDKGAVYAHIIERPYRVERDPGEDDAYLSGAISQGHQP
jgi:hypothetical protein